MTKTVSYISEVAEVNERNILVKSEHLYMYEPKIFFSGGRINWFDDSQLLKTQNTKEI